MEALNILLTSAGRRSYLVEFFKKALAGRGLVHVANSSEISPAFLVADKSVVSPLIYDSNYVDFLLEYCEKHRINAIISLFDIDLPVLAANKSAFEERGIQVIVSDPDVINTCNDKWETYQFVLSLGLNAPKTYKRLEDAQEAIWGRELSYPVFIKPRWGMGSIGVFEAENQEELNCFYNKVKNVISKTYLKYESEQTPEDRVLIQEKIPGQEYGLDIMNDLQGNYCNTSVKMKYAMRSGETDCAVTVNDETLKDIGKKISEAFHHIGNLDADVFLHEGKGYVLEMNARFGGGYPFSHVAGVNMPQAIVNWLLGMDVPKSFFEPQVGVMAQKNIDMMVLN